MQPVAMPLADKQLDSIPESIKQAFLLFAILQELLVPLLSLLRRSASIEDVFAQVQNLRSGNLGASNDEESKSYTSSP